MATRLTKVERNGDTLRIVGIVDDAEVVAHGWFSALKGTRAEKIAYAKAQLNAAVPPGFSDLGLAD